METPAFSFTPDFEFLKTIGSIMLQYAIVWLMFTRLTGWASRYFICLLKKLQALKAKNIGSASLLK